MPSAKLVMSFESNLLSNQTSEGGMLKIQSLINHQMTATSN